MNRAVADYLETVKQRPRLNQSCCTCGEMIHSRSYHIVGRPGCCAGPRDPLTGRRPVWVDGLYTHTRCRPGTKRWYDSLGTPVPGFETLFNLKSDAMYMHCYSTAKFNDKPTLEEEIDADVS